ncbi:hypothetical protein ABZ202_27540 [Streptomyces sp. NPDC006186]|uniref:hypothetical protein n=1 Tax=Streptomyces sp. NPDC006186 TaxID=3155248 RepID=UPI0033B6D4E7
MTELSTEPVAVEAPAPQTPPPDPAPPEQTPPASEVEHTPGGWPVVPLALSGANSTVGAVATASLAGGPIAAMVAATGVVVLGTFAAARSRKPNPRRDARRAAARMAGCAAARSAGLRRSGPGAATGGRGGGGRSTGARHGRTGNRSGGVPGQHRRSTGPAARHGAATSGKTLGKSGHGTARHLAGAAGKAASRAGQIRALRAAQKEAGGSRADKRAQTTAARRAVADARRRAKAASGTNRPGKRGGLAGRLTGAAVHKARAARDAAIARHRARRDKRAANTVAAQRARVRKASARKAARKALRRSAGRFHGRRLLAALLALPLGLLGLITSPIGRKLGIPWLIHPGRRLYRRLAGVAAEQRAARDAAIREELAEQEAAADAQAAEDGTDGIADSVQRPAATVPTSSSTSQVSEGAHVSGFRFEEAAAEMEQAANSYDPEDCMEILAMVEGLPAALASVANVMKILAERSDSEFPLEKEVAGGFNDIFGALMASVAVAEDMGPLFRQVHAQDIARHEDPRNGHEAEKGWNV